MKRLVIFALLLVSLHTSIPHTAMAQEDMQCATPIPAQPPVQEYSPHANGHGVRVAVIDTGITPHESFPVVHDSGDFVSPDNPNALFDCDGHGTFVASVIVSIAPAVELISIRQTSGYISSAESGNLATLAHAIHASLDAGAQVINISVVACVDASQPVDTHILHEALARAEADNAVVIAASGNRGPDCNDSSIVYPTEIDTVMGVTARAPDFRLAEYSLPGGEFSAPGEVASAASPAGHGWASGTTSPQGQTTDIRGTSFAAPVVTGTVALIRQRYPDMSASEIRSFLSSAAQPAGGFIDPHTVISHLPAQTTAQRQASISFPAQAPSSVTEKAHHTLLVLGILALMLLVTHVRFTTRK